MQANLDRCLDLIGVAEGGYSDNPLDPGGATNRGVTIKTLAAWRGRAVSKQDVMDLSMAEAREIIAAQYAIPIRFDALPAGLDYAMLDTSVNSGPDRAVRLLQAALGMEDAAIDGVFGLHTKAALDAETDRDGLIISYCNSRLNFMKKLRTWGTFGTGWSRRVQRVQIEAMMMAEGKPTPARPVIDEAPVAKAIGPTKVLSIASGRAAVATVATVAAAAGAAATQATGILSPYSEVGIVRYVLIGLALVASMSSVIVTLGRARAGATS